MRRRPERGAQEGRRVARQLPHVLLQLPPEVAPGVVGVGLLEARLGEGVHHRRLGEGLRQPDDLGMVGGHVGDQPLPERDRLGVGVVDPEERHAVVDPDLDHPAHLGVGAVGVVVEVQGIDVLVLLRRVLGIRDGPVRPHREPLGVLGDVGVVGGALEGDVEGDLEAVAPGGADEDVEVVEGAEVGVDRVVAAVGRADGVGAARVVGPGVQGVVAALARGRADRVDRGEVDDVEAHACDRLEPLRGGAQRAGVPAAALLVVPGPLGPREDLVPRAEEGELALDEQPVCRAGADHLAERVRGEERVHLGRGGGGQAGAGRAVGVAQGGDRVTRLGGVDPRRRRGDSAFEDSGPLLQHHLGIDVGLDLDGRVVHPRRIGVGPPLDPVGPPAGPVGDDARAPPGEPEVVEGHRKMVVDAVGVGEDGGGVHRVVALAEHLGRDGELLALDRLRGAGAAVDEGTHVLDGDPLEGCDPVRQGAGQGGGREVSRR